MHLINFSKNEDSINKQVHIESVLLYGNSDAVPDAKITICIPTYKRADLLKEALESSINQSSNIPYKIIVVDNDPDFDNTKVLDIIRAFNRDNLLYYKNKENLMPFGNLNRCIVLAKTPWVALLHDDDLLLENYIHIISNILVKRGKRIDGLSIVPVHLNYQFDFNIIKKNNHLRQVLKKMFSFMKHLTYQFFTIPCSANLFLGNVYGSPTCGMIFKRDSFIKSGGFNQTYFPSADWFFLIFFSQKYRFYKYRKNLGFYRWSVNTSLRKDVLESFKNDRNKCIKSLGINSKLCRFWVWVLKKDFNIIMNSQFNEYIKTSTLYNLVCLIYSFLYN